MDASVDVPLRVWSVAAWQTVVGTVAVLVLTPLALAAWRHGLGHDLGRTAIALFGMVGESCLLVVALYAARRVRATAGGWGPALGWARPTLGDLGWGVLWLVVQLFVSLGLYSLFEAIVPASTLHASRNLRSLTYHGPWWLAIALVTAVVIAPIAEETQCRGVLLRAGMSRWSFTRSALLSSLFFGLLHADQAGSLGGAVVLTVTIVVFGFFQCLVVRMTGRLAPAAIAHGLNNGLGLLVALSH